MELAIQRLQQYKTADRGRNLIFMYLVHLAALMYVEHASSGRGRPVPQCSRCASGRLLPPSLPSRRPTDRPTDVSRPAVLTYTSRSPALVFRSSPASTDRTLCGWVGRSIGRSTCFSSTLSLFCALHGTGVIGGRPQHRIASHRSRLSACIRACFYPP